MAAPTTYPIVLITDGELLDTAEEVARLVAERAGAQLIIINEPDEED